MYSAPLASGAARDKEYTSVALHSKSNSFDSLRLVALIIIGTGQVFLALSSTFAPVLFSPSILIYRGASGWSSLLSLKRAESTSRLSLALVYLLVAAFL